MGCALILCWVLADGPPPDLVVLPPALDGEIDETAGASLSAALADGLARAGLHATEIARDAPCPDRRCAANEAQRAGAGYAIVPTFGAEGRDYTLEVALIDVAAPDRLVAVSQACELCGLSEAQEVVGDLAVALSERLAQFARPARLSVLSTPDGATVSSRDTTLGITPLDIELDPGPYRLRLTRDGFIPQDRDVVAVAGARTQVELTLQPEPVARRSLGLHLAGGAFDLLGAGALGAGIGLLAVHGRAYRPSCDEPRDPVTGRCRQRYDTLAGGVAAVAGGVASLGAAIALHVIAARRNRGSRTRRRTR